MRADGLKHGGRFSVISSHSGLFRPGTHDWDYWEMHIVDTLDFVMKHAKR
jgi:S-formylglutathione hydrolase FrmB